MALTFQVPRHCFAPSRGFLWFALSRVGWFFFCRIVACLILHLALGSVAYISSPLSPAFRPSVRWAALVPLSSCLHYWPCLLTATAVPVADAYPHQIQMRETSNLTMRCADSPCGAHRAPVTEPATTCAPAGSAPVTRSACVTRRSNPLSALEKKRRTAKVSRQPNGL